MLMNDVIGNYESCRRALRGAGVLPVGPGTPFSWMAFHWPPIGRLAFPGSQSGTLRRHF